MARFRVLKWRTAIWIGQPTVNTLVFFCIEGSFATRSLSKDDLENRPDAREDAVNQRARTLTSAHISLHHCPASTMAAFARSAMIRSGAINSQHTCTRVFPTDTGCHQRPTRSFFCAQDHHDERHPYNNQNNQKHYHSLIHAVLDETMSCVSSELHSGKWSDYVEID